MLSLWNVYELLQAFHFLRLNSVLKVSCQSSFHSHIRRWKLSYSAILVLKCCQKVVAASPYILSSLLFLLSKKSWSWALLLFCILCECWLKITESSTSTFFYAGLNFVLHTLFRTVSFSELTSSIPYVLVLSLLIFFH